MGLLACGALSLMMKQAVGLQTEQRRVPWLPAIEARFGERLVGPVLVREEQQDASKDLVVSVRLAKDADAARTAQAIGSEVWMHVARAGGDTQRVVVVVRRGDDEPLRYPFAHPAPKR